MTKPNWKPQKIKLGQIQAWDNNPRMSTKAQAQRIIASERKFGQPVPFLLQPEKDGRFPLLDGHQRLSAWFTVYGADYQMDAMVADRPLTEAEHKELIITLHTGATGSWNWDNLSSWNAGDLQEWGMNGDALKSWNNDANNLKELLTAEVEPVDAEPQTDRAGELAEKWQTASGQLWKLGDHRLLIGDCTVRENVERLMGGERADCVITDPPFAIYGSSTGVGDDVADSKMIEPFFKEIFKNIKHILDGHFYIWCDWRTYPIIFSLLNSANLLTKNLIVWNKVDMGMGGFYRNTHEFIVTGYGRDNRTKMRGKQTSGMISDSNVWNIKRVTQKVHTAEKPVEIYERAIKNSTVDAELIVDFFGGSGVSFIAAHNLNRRCYAMEISEKYGAVILQRFLDATGIQPELVE